ncbi:MAG: glycosyltransferase family 2 protein [Candidatus Aureabacteria bacterium]|nr:glycosyltransferase family 2 protein [Candidatus Auribacterota bacterium]MCK5654741.1 glycosyltransferase family 2 protein [Candidatus Auribacterota bacterium]
MAEKESELGLSICIPVFNEEGNIPVIVDRIMKVMKNIPGYSYEIVVVDDCSTDRSWQVMLETKQKCPFLRCLQFEENSGESAAEDAALKSSGGRVLMTIDADLENDPADIPAFLEKIREFDCVCGTRVGMRKDGFIKNISSRVANKVRNSILKDEITDAGCTYRAFKKECFESILMYNGFHRFLPTLFKMEGFSVIEIPVKHAKRLHGESKYGVWNRVFKSFLDMLAVRWMKKRKLLYRIKQEK